MINNVNYYYPIYKKCQKTTFVFFFFSITSITISFHSSTIVVSNNIVEEFQKNLQFHCKQKICSNKELFTYYTKVYIILFFRHFYETRKMKQCLHDISQHSLTFALMCNIN